MNETQRLRITDLLLPITDHASPITHYNRNITYALKFKINIGTVETLLPLAICPLPISLWIKSDTMSELVNQSLQKIAKGTGIIFTGTIIGMLLAFIGRVIIVRYTTQTEYGIFSLALVLMSIFAMISTLGLQSGVTRQIAFFRGKNDNKKVKGILNSSIQLALVASIFFSVFLLLLADIISVNAFHSPELSTPLKIFAVAIPFSVFIAIFTSIFQGFDRVEPHVYFPNILRDITFILYPKTFK